MLLPRWIGRSHTHTLHSHGNLFVGDWSTDRCSVALRNRRLKHGRVQKAEKLRSHWNISRHKPFHLSKYLTHRSIGDLSCDVRISETLIKFTFICVLVCLHYERVCAEEKQVEIRCLGNRILCHGCSAICLWVCTVCQRHSSMYLRLTDTLRRTDSGRKDTKYFLTVA